MINDSIEEEPVDSILIGNNVEFSAAERSHEVQTAEIEEEPENGIEMCDETGTTAVFDETENRDETCLLDNTDRATLSEPDFLDEAVLLEEVKKEQTAEISPPLNEHVASYKSTLENDPLCDIPTTESCNEDQSVAVMEVDEAESDNNVRAPKNYEQDYFHSNSVIEIGRCSWDKGINQNYVRGCLWSPDGTCVLTTINNDGMHIFELPSDMYGTQQVSQQRPVNLLDSAVHVRESTLVYDYKWYPVMHSSMPETSVWIASRQHEPIQMWDAYTGKLRCSYKGYNAVDEVESALSLTWTTDGGQIYGGYKKSIKVFDVNTPGREVSSFPTKVTASCLTPCIPLPNLMIFGSWSRTITALVTNSGQTIAIGNNSSECSHTSGVTWLKFIPRTNLFLSGGRKDPKLLMWDIRSLHKPYHILERNCNTNQRVYFDTSPHGEWILTGNTDGNVRVWNLLEIEATSKSYRQYNFPLHRDCCNGVSFHPSLPIIATASGQFHAVDESADSSQNDEQSQCREQENSLTLWSIGKTAISEE